MSQVNGGGGKSEQGCARERQSGITEGIRAGSRGTGVTGCQVEQVYKRAARVSFTAETIFGEIPVERTVTTNV